jgi:hypothetical protein
MSPNIGIFSSALAAVLLFLLLWRRRELRRYEAMELCDHVRDWGLDDLARLLRAYTVGNYIGRDSVVRIARELIEKIKTEGMPALLRKVGWKMLVNVFLKNPEDLKKVREELALAEARANPPAIVPAALAAAAPPVKPVATIAGNVPVP